MEMTAGLSAENRALHQASRDRIQALQRTPEEQR
jgi:hypothetical protein